MLVYRFAALLFHLSWVRHGVATVLAICVAPNLPRSQILARPLFVPFLLSMAQVAQVTQVLSLVLPRLWHRGEWIGGVTTGIECIKHPTHCIHRGYTVLNPTYLFLDQVYPCNAGIVSNRDSTRRRGYFNFGQGRWR